MKLFERYFFKELFKMFALTLGTLYLLFILIDYSTHMKTFRQAGLDLIDVGGYYALQLSCKADILIPVALLISTIQVLTTMNAKNELIALSSAGLSFHRLLRPFLIVAGALTFLIYLNFQCLFPMALNRLENFESAYLKESKEYKHQAKHVELKDGSLLLYQSYNAKERSFFDVYWIVNSYEIYRIKRLFAFADHPKGESVDHFVREKTGEIKKKSSLEKLTFPTMNFERKMIHEGFVPPSERSILQLWKGMSLKKIFNLTRLSDKEATSRSHFYYKLTIPLLSFLTVMAVSPFCIKFGRHIPLFFIYSLSLFALIAFITLVNASLILAISQVAPPFVAIFSLYIFAFSVFGFRYASL